MKEWFLRLLRRGGKRFLLAILILWILLGLALACQAQGVIHPVSPQTKVVLVLGKAKQRDCGCVGPETCTCGDSCSCLYCVKHGRVVTKKAETCPSCGKDNCSCGCNGDPLSCYCSWSSWEQGVQKAIKVGKPIVLFVNCKPRYILGCIDCYEKTFEDNGTPRIEFAWPNGEYVSRFSTPFIPNASQDEILTRWENYKIQRSKVLQAPPVVQPPVIMFPPPPPPMMNFGGWGFGGGGGGGC